MKKRFVVFVIILLSSTAYLVHAKESCYDTVDEECTGGKRTEGCSSKYSAISYNINSVRNYINQQIAVSFDYLILASSFGNYRKNRPGLQKQIQALSDKAWNNAFDLIKHITLRGEEHKFNSLPNYRINKTLELGELQALTLAVDTEKKLAIEAHDLHQSYSHANHRKESDAEMAHYLEEKIIEEQAGCVRKLVGWTNDLRNMAEHAQKNQQRSASSLAFYLFDEYLLSQ